MFYDVPYVFNYFFLLFTFRLLHFAMRKTDFYNPIAYL